MKRTHLGAACSLLAGSLLVAGRASAQRVPASNGPGFDTHLFRPAVDSKGFFSVNGSDTFGAGGVSFGLVNDYGHNVLRLTPGHGDDALIANAFYGTFFFNYGVFDALEVGLQAPVVLQTGKPLQDVGPTGGTYSDGDLTAQRLSFVAAHAKLRLLRPQQALGLALLVQGGVPTTSDSARDLAADPKAWFWPQVIVDKHLGPEGEVGMFRLGLNAGYRVGGGVGTTRFDQLTGGHFESSRGLVTGGAALSIRVFPPVDVVGELYGTRQTEGNSDSKVATSAEAIGGLKLFVERNSYLLLGGGGRVTDGFEAASARAVLGFVYEPSIYDRDGDGIPDDQDACPDVPGVRSSDPSKNGCPPDRDGDGIPDSEDACPDVPGVRSADPKKNGCPPDRDGDGILDSEDACPDVPGVRNADPAKNGCPPDRDGDGIPDSEDACPDVPGVRNADPKKNGCPPDKDRDFDGIPDSQDACPDVPGVPDPDPRKNGCPPEKPRVVVQENNIVIFEKILFERGSAKILPASSSLLDAIARTLREHSEFGLVEVQGHADERGGVELNVRLTKARAQSVVDALAARGIGREKLRPMGYGKFCPVDPGHNEEAWEKNRRVEFKVVVSDGKATGAQLGCDEAKAHGIVSPPGH